MHLPRVIAKGETTINAAAVYPYDIYKSCFNGNAAVANEQWKAFQTIWKVVLSVSYQ